MSGTIDIAPDGSCLLVSFPYREDLVELVRNVPGRRWDKPSKTWRVPLDQAEATVKIFMAHGFSIMPGVATALATGGRDTGLDRIKYKAVDKDADSYTISALNLRVAEVLRAEFGKPMWVVGELQNYDKGKHRKHRYFELVERVEDELGEEEVRATVPAVIWAKHWSVIQKRLGGKGGRDTRQLDLSDGVKIRVRGRVDFYQARGKYQFVVEDLDPEYTLGAQLLRREKILQRLQSEGLKDRNAELAMPLVPLRIGLLTSADSDAYNDFVNTLADEAFGYSITLFPVNVQGKELEASVLAGLEWFAERAEDYDLLVISRGGGSRSELDSWDNEKVAFALAQHPLKAIIGIGHERDHCVLDFIAQSVKTPTAAAELINETVRKYQEQVEDTMLAIQVGIEEILRNAARQLAQRGRSFGHLMRAGLADEKAALSNRARVLKQELAARLKEQRRELARSSYALEHNLKSMLAEEKRHVVAESQRLQFSLAQRLEREGDRLEARSLRQRALDPARVLERGFALLRGNKGKALRSVTETKPGDSIEALLPDGRLTLETREVHEKAQKKS
ncbi:MAG: exodeoxyribonuclease VII large subunit [Planctomycetota bacterium]|nr:MAG: exodeoxyribonuclease VII large subunit [Planctomycetota bacterium]